jgi:hypothetical protein
MMLNEVRKREISLGLFEFINLSPKERKMSPDPMQLRKISRTNEELQRFVKLSGTEAISDLRVLCYIESIMLFSVLWGVGQSITPRAQSQFSNFLVAKIQ